MCIRPRAVWRKRRDGVGAGSGRCCSQRNPVASQRGGPLTGGNGLTSTGGSARRHQARAGGWVISRKDLSAARSGRACDAQVSGQDLWEVRRPATVFCDGHHCRPARKATSIPHRAESRPARRGGKGGALASTMPWADEAGGATGIPQRRGASTGCGLVGDRRISFGISIETSTPGVRTALEGSDKGARGPSAAR